MKIFARGICVLRAITLFLRDLKYPDFRENNPGVRGLAAIELSDYGKNRWQSRKEIITRYSA